jgi:hypothetical protein
MHLQITSTPQLRRIANPSSALEQEMRKVAEVHRVCQKVLKEGRSNTKSRERGSIALDNQLPAA